MDLKERVRRFNRYIIGFALFLAIFSLILEYGFYFSSFSFIFHFLEIISAGLLTIYLLISYLTTDDKISFLADNRGYFIFIFIFLIIFSFAYFQKIPITFSNFLNKFLKIDVLTFLIQLYLIIFLFLSTAQINQLISSVKGTFLRPLLLIPLTFILLIFTGTVLLLLPKSTTNGHISFVDALFTATSATCVTGLVIKDTGSFFTRFGQIVILLLIQIGALGIMTFTTFFGIILGRKIGVKERALLSDALNLKVVSKIVQTVIGIVFFTFIIEILGALFLYFRFIPYFGKGLYTFYLAIFHAISGFANAGFSLFSTSFKNFQADLGINLIMSILIIFGGLGFIVLFDLFRWVRSKIKKQRANLTLHSKVVLLVSIFLIIFGMFFIYLFESKNLLAGYSLKTKLLSSYFQSVTARTAGFNTISIKSLTLPSTFILILLMFVGASPGSTGGGIKTSTFAVLILTIREWLTGRKEPRIFKRKISTIVVHQALCVFFLALVWILGSTLILLVTEKTNFMDALFEEISAFGTVGLSRGLTKNLSTAGKLVITISMLVGRIGPLLVAIYVGRKGIVEKYTYPQEEVFIG